MGTIQIDGSTPKITVGNATAEDATILFDGNAQDFYIALDDSADDLLIGLGSTVGSTPIISMDENKKVSLAADVELTAGNLIIGTSGKGIDFSATADSGASMASELLDDYEEGTWTVQDTDSGGSNQHGMYTKIGNLVTCYFVLTTGAISGGSTFYLTNLPFTVGSTDAFRGPVSISYTNATNMPLAGNVTENSTTAYLLIGTGDIATDDEIGSSKVIAGSMIYRV